MKKIIVGILVLCCLAGCLVGCGDEKNPSKDSDSSTSNISADGTKNNAKEKYFIKINNKKIEFPCKLKKFEDIGLVLNSSDVEKLQNSSSEYEMVNLEAEGLPILEAYVETGKEDTTELTVAGFSIPSYVIDGFKFEFNGLIQGQSTIDDVLSVLGDPEIPKQVDKTKHINALSYKRGRLVVGTEDGIFMTVQYIGAEE